MPGATHSVVDNQALGQRSVVVGAMRAYGKKVVIAAHKDHFFVLDVPEQDPAIW
jgi:hypothetical protein